MKTHLKIKILTLADEAKHIKRHEQRWKQVKREGIPHPLFFDLQGHRKYEVRPECRCALLAYGFLRGRDYRKIENKCHEPPDWNNVVKIILRFSNIASDKAPAERYLLMKDEIKLWSEKIPND